MKSKFLLNILLLTILISGCNGIFQNGKNKNPYSKLYFERRGGGNKEFYVKYLPNPKLLIFDIIKYAYVDTNYTIIKIVDYNLSDLYNTVEATLNGEIEIEGEFKQPTLIVGTWIYIYVIDQAGELEEITNIDLRNKLLELEQIVENNK